MKLIADAGPIIALAKIDRLSVVEPLFDEIWLPDIVVHEVLAKPGIETRRIEEAIRRFIRVAPQRSNLAIHLEPFARGLDEGEKSVIAFARTSSPTAVPAGRVRRRAGATARRATWSGFGTGM
jgi:predicted nucleic acid-binding protein